MPKLDLKDSRLKRDEATQKILVAGGEYLPGRLGFILEEDGVMVITDQEYNILHVWPAVPDTPLPSEQLSQAQMDRFFTHDWAQYKQNPTRVGPFITEQRTCDGIFCRFQERHGERIVKTCRRALIDPEVWVCPDCYLYYMLGFGMELYFGYKELGIIVLKAEFTNWRLFWAKYQELWTAFYQLPFPYVITEGPREYILLRAKEELQRLEYQIFQLWVQGAQQQQIADQFGKSIGFINTRLRRIREGPMGFWFEDFVKGEGKRSGHEEPDLIAKDGTPVNLKCVGDKRTSKIKRDKLQPEITYAKAKSTKVRIRVYNIVHDREQVLEYAPLEIPIEIQVDW